MSRTTIQDALVSTIGNITGINDCFLGLPESFPTSDAPVAWIDMKYLGSDRETCGDAGTVAMYYRGRITVLVGAEDMHPDDAAEAAGPIADLIRHALYADETLGGVVWRCVPTPGGSSDNLDTYDNPNAGDYPKLYISLDITDYVDANAAANA